MAEQEGSEAVEQGERTVLPPKEGYTVVTKKNGV